jgi:hypothetical protein
MTQEARLIPQETLLVRLKPHEPRRGHVLRRFTYAGIKFHEERGWYRVSRDIAAYLKTVHQVPGDTYTPAAFDVCTDEEARQIDAREESESKVRKSATDELKLSPARGELGALTTADLPEQAPRPQPGATRADTMRADAMRTDAARADAARTDAGRADTTRADATRADEGRGRKERG